MELRIDHLNKAFKVKSNVKQLPFLKKNNNVTKVSVLNNLDLTVQNQEMYCLLGNNGAGKSTLMNCVGGIHIPDSGSIYLKNKQAEINVLKDSRRAKKFIVFNFQDPKFDTRLSAKSNLDFHLRMYMIERETRKKLITEYLKLFNLFVKKDSKVYFLSGGQKKQLENIRGFITAKALIKKDILFLTDEPTAYCDVVAKNIIWKELEDICFHGTVLFSTNDLHEAERLTKTKNGKIGFIKEGSIVFSGTIEDLENKLSRRGKLSLVTESPLEGINFEIFQKHLSEQFNEIVFTAHPEQRLINLKINQSQINEVLNEAIEYLQEKKIFIDKIEKLKPTINDLFIEEEIY